MKLSLQQLEAHLWGAANILRGKTAGQDYKNYILSLMFYKRLSDQWECEADDGIAELERQQGRAFSEKERAVFRKRGEHRFKIPDGSRWGDVKAASTNIGGVLTKAMRAVADANDELRGVFTVDWNQPAPDGSGKPLIPNEVVHALIQHFDEHDLSNKSVPSDVLGRAYEYLIKQFADDAGAKAGEFFTPPEVGLEAMGGATQRHPHRVYVMGQRTKWGNCSAERNLSFNWRLILAPDFVLRYLVTYETVHLVIPDHSAKFWLTVQSLCPETERAKQWLRRHQAQLTIHLGSALDGSPEGARYMPMKLLVACGAGS